VRALVYCKEEENTLNINQINKRGDLYFNGKNICSLYNKRTSFVSIGINNEKKIDTSFFPINGN
jgi:hypothetical protein